MMNVISNLVKNPRFNSIFLRQLSRTSTKSKVRSPTKFLFILFFFRIQYESRTYKHRNKTAV